MADGELGAVFTGLAADSDQAAGNISESLAKLGEQTADNEEGNLARTLDAEAQNTKSFTDIADGGDGELAPSASAAEAGGGGEPGGGDEGGDGAGQHSEGNGAAETGGTDPVDVVSGQLLISVLDLVLPGVLALALRRAYASGYRAGGLFGVGWSSTLDLRLIVDQEGVRFLGDDAQTLEYPEPVPGTPVLPRHGARRPLVADPTSDEYRLEDEREGLTWLFPFAGTDSSATRPLRAIRDRNGNEITMIRDARGRLLEVAHSGGYRVTVDSVDGPAGPRVTGLRLADGSATGISLLTFQYDQTGRLTGIVNSSGVAYRYLWDEQDRIAGWIDRIGSRYDYTYDELGRVVRAGGDDGYLVATLRYDVERRVTTVVDGLGQATGYHYDRFQHVTKTVDAVDGEVRTEYDRYGRLLGRTDELGHTTVVERDEHGNPVRVLRPDGSALAVEYNSLHQQVRVTRPNGAEWRYGYDERGNLLSSTDPLGASTVFGYDARGALVEMTDALGISTTFEVDSAGLPIIVTDARGAVTRSSRDAFGRVTVLADPLGAVTRTGWNVEGMPLWRRSADGATEHWAYDPAGNLARSVDAAGAITTYEYGSFQRVTARVEPTGVRHEFDYDAALRLTRVTGPTGLNWDYTLDAVGNVIAEQDFNGRIIRYQHDAAGQLVARTNGLDEIITYQRDIHGRVVERRSGEKVYRYRYDQAGDLVQADGPDTSLVYERDALGRPLTESIDGRTVRHHYDAVGNPTRRVTPTGMESVWAFDESGLPRSLVTSAGELGFGFDATGREIRRSLGSDVVVSQSFDPAGRLSGQNIAVGSSTLQRRTYAYRADGVPTAVQDLLSGGRTYHLDLPGRAVAVSTPQWSERYAYDQLGNLTFADLPSGTPDIAETRGPREFAGTLIRRAGRVGYEHDAQGRLVRQTRRTLSGQLRVHTYTWDADDRLVGALLPDGTRWTYHYDPLGRRAAKRHLARDGALLEQIRFVWDGTRLVEHEHTDRDGHITLLTWDWEPGTHRAVAQSRRRGMVHQSQNAVDAEFWAIVNDLSGTPHELVSPDGRIDWRRTATTWGESVLVVGANVDCPLRFPGQYHDVETGFDYNLHRYYDPETARYASADPLGLQPQPNEYAYVRNPFFWQDPTGLAGEQINWNWRSVKTFGHAFSRHGAGGKNFRNLIGRAATEGTPQGQWLDNDKAAEFLKGQYDPAKTEPWEVDLPPGLGQIVNDDGTTTPAARARLVPNNRGVYRSAFPIPGENPCPSA